MDNRKTHLFVPVLIGVFALSGIASAATYINDDVTTTTLNTAGTTGDPTINILTAESGPYDYVGSINVGASAAAPYVELRVLSGATATGTGTPYYIGGGLGSDYVKVLVDGVGSSYSAPGELRFDRGNHGNLTVQNGGTVTVSGALTVGYRNEAELGTYNSIVIDNATLNAETRTILGYNSFNHHNTVSVINGGLLSITGDQRFSIGRGGSDNNVTVSGAGSTFLVDTTRNLALGELGDAERNTLTIENSGLVQLTEDDAGALTLVNPSVNANYVQINGGFLAWNGDRTSWDATGRVQLWNGSAYETLDGTNEALLDWAVTYYATDTEAQAATGYEGLGGYTVFTGGVPEPATLALLSMGGLAMLRRRR